MAEQTPQERITTAAAGLRRRAAEHAIATFQHAGHKPRTDEEKSEHEARATELREEHQNLLTLESKVNDAMKRAEGFDDLARRLEVLIARSA